MRGGARARSGPPPDPNALRRDRRDDKGTWTTLPAEGREGAPPDWPLTDATEREADLWEKEWKRPQAVEWERNGQQLEVAMYVRTLVGAENPRSPTNLRQLLKQQQEALGLSLPGLLRNRWKIGEAEAATPKRRTTRSARSRLKVVDGGAG